MRELINWTEVSKKLAGNDNSIRSNKCPKKYQKKIERLIRILEDWFDSTRFAIATETTDDIVKGRKYKLIEIGSVGYCIIDESGEEVYYHHSSLNFCDDCVDTGKYKPTLQEPDGTD